MRVLVIKYKNQDLSKRTDLGFTYVYVSLSNRTKPHAIICPSK